MSDQIQIGGNLIEVVQANNNDTVYVGNNLVEVVYSSPDDSIYIGNNIIEVACVYEIIDKYKYQAFLF